MSVTKSLPQRIFRVPALLLHYWDALWFTKADPYMVGIFRFYLGLVLTLYYIMHSSTWSLFYGTGGVHHAYPHSISEYRFFDSILPLFQSEFQSWFYYWVCLIASVSLCLGIMSKLACLWLWISNFSIMFANIWITNAEEQVWAFVLLYALFMPLNASFTLRHWLGRAGVDKEKPEPLQVLWAVRLLQVHIAFIYLVSFPMKIYSDSAWRDGNMVYYATHEILYSRWPELGIFAWGGGTLSIIATYGTLAIEAIFPIFVWKRSLQRPLTVFLMLFHMSLALFLEGVALFNLAMVVALIPFLPPPKRDG